MKMGKWHIEYSVTLLIILAVVLLFTPTSIKSTFQANMIAKWKDCFKKLEYAHDAIIKQEKSEILTSFKRAQTPDEREEIFVRIIKPYFRLSEKKVKRHYKVRYMNGNKIGENDELYVDDYYFTNNRKMIVGIKDIPGKKDNAMFIMTFDVNGYMPPNKWGKDVFGAKIYADKVEAIGRELTIDKQNEDCSIEASGVSCSNYYIIGGGFND